MAALIAVQGSVHKYSGGGAENKEPEGGSKKILPQKGVSKKFRSSKRGGQNSFDHPNTHFFVCVTCEI